MTDWIKGRRKEYDARKQAEQDAGRLQVHKAGVLKERARSVLDAVTEAVTRHVEEYQQEFDGLPEKRVDFNRKPSGGFSLYKATYPAASVETMLDPATNSIVGRYSFRLNSNADTRTSQVTIQLGVDDRDNIVMSIPGQNVATPEDVSRYLIEKVLFN